ncbi:MAG: glycosyltransferase [bacterium]|nr:glycosyltransferase [bacterium]
MIAPGHSVHSLRPLKWLLELGHEVIFFDKENPFPKGKERYLYIPYPAEDDSFVIPLLKELTGELEPHLVHVHWVDRRAYQCAKAGLEPLFLTVWGSDINNYYRDDGEVSMPPQHMTKTLTHAHTIFIDAEDLREKCTALANGNLPVELLSPGVNTSLFKPGYDKEAAALKEKLDIPQDANVILSIRAMTPLYDHEQILRAFDSVRQTVAGETILVFKHYNNTHFKDYETQLQELIDTKGLSHAVRWVKTMPYEELPALYAMSHVIVNFPKVDAFPVTFLEAAACQRPVVTCDLPAYQDTFAHRYFKTVHSRDAALLAEAITEVLENQNPTTEDNLNPARLAVREDYDETKTRERMQHFYNISVSTRSKEKPGRNPLLFANVPRYLEKALRQWRLTGDITPKQRYHLGSVYEHIGAYDDARRCFLELLDNCDDQRLIPGILFHLGEIARTGKQEKEAMDYFKQCLQHNPGHRKAKEYIEK